MCWLQRPVMLITGRYADKKCTFEAADEISFLLTKLKDLGFVVGILELTSRAHKWVISCLIGSLPVSFFLTKVFCLWEAFVTRRTRSQI